ncbi:F-box protein [Sporobolomyces salmoneus]|uniref:F-box protein n=1 Tax=Sporobolomyces salmoneus TaxID=183962 RepID=UPI003171DB64
MPKKAKGPSLTTTDDSQGAPPPPKRARNAQSRVKGRKGALQGVLELPMDLIWEICTHLDVGDLLALSNTNKSFRSVVTGESSSMLFKRARQRIGLPELLSPMPDLRYAELMFGKGCNICGKANAGKVDPSFRARICSACYKDKFFEPGTDQFNNAERDLNRYTTFCTHPTVALKRNSADRGKSSYYISSFKRISAELDAKFPASAKRLSPWEDNKQTQIEIDDIRHRDDEADEEKVEEIEAALASRTSDWVYVSDIFYRKLPVETLTPEGDFQKWYGGFHKDRELRDKDAQALQEWMNKMKTKKNEENKKRSSSRRQEIERRFEAMGFDKDEFRAQNFRDHSQVKSVRPLSDRTFSSTVEPPIRQVLEENRRRRLRSTLKTQYENFVKKHSDREYFPPSNLYIRLPILEPVLNDASHNPSSSSTLPPDIAASARQQISKLVRDRREKLLRAIVTAYTRLVEDRNRDNETKEEEKAKSKNYSPLDELPLNLPRLPPWIPRINDKPILASDEQLATFLESSPLALVECSECRRAFSVRDLFEHFTSSCINSTSRFPLLFLASRPVKNEEDWLRIGDSDEAGKQFARIDKEVLQRSLKLQQVIESTPLVVDESKQLPSLGDDYSLGEEKPDWFDVSLRCACQTDSANDMSLSAMYRHIVDNSLQSDKCKIGIPVNYSKSHRRRWRELRNRKHSETQEFVEEPGHTVPENSSLRRWDFLSPSDFASEESEKGEDEDEKGGCIVM